jgi:hypothetical protein
MGDTRVEYRILTGKPEGKRPLGKPRVNGRIILKWIFKKWEREAIDWIGLIQNTDMWRPLVNAVMNLPVP